MFIQHRRFVSPGLALGMFLSCLSAFPQGAPPNSRAKMVNITAPRPVAAFDGTPVTEEDLRKAAASSLDELSIQIDQMNANVARMEHRILETSLLHLLAEKMFEAEAAKLKITKEAYLDKELQGKVQEPAQQEVAAFYEANRQRFSAPLDKVTEQIRQYLKAQNREKAMGDLAERLKSEYKVKIFLPPLRQDVKTSGNPSIGPLGAPVTIVEFSDFQCSACAQLAKTLRQVAAKYGDRVRLVYRQFPLVQTHPLAEKAAEASLCAEEQNRFWEFADLAFETQNALQPADLKAKAAKLGLDAAAFDQCLASGKYAPKVMQDERDAFSLAANTPSIFINGRFVPGAGTLEEISKIIEEEIILRSAASPLGNQ